MNTPRLQRSGPAWRSARGLAGALAGVAAIGTGWAAANRAPAAPETQTMTAVAAWSSQPVDPRSCKPRPPFGVQSWVEASGSWVVRVANPGIARDLVVTAWSETTAPAIVWQGRMAPDESRTLTIGAPPAGANRLSAAVEPLLDTPAASGSGGTAGGDAHAPPILRSISVLERQPHGAAAGAPEPELRIDPDTGERVLDLPGTLGTAP